MVEDDTFTYHVKQLSRDQANTAAYSLITKERTQKLDLLIHLLSNLTQALAVCGPEGIGKTTLLKVLQERKTELWRYCLMQGNADLSFEAIQEQLAQAQPDKSGQSLSMAGRYEGQHKQVVLIIDNAGELVPGLIAAIIQYAAANPVLRVIFALTHDELQMKRGSDRVIDDCHIVEIPPLSEKQCGDFLQYLSMKPYANLSFKAISENMIAYIYRETHGVPGRIIAEVSGLSGAKQGGKLKWILVLAVAAVIAIAFGVQWLASSRNNNKKVIAPTSVEQKVDTSAPLSASIQQKQSVIALSRVEAPVNEGKNALDPSLEVNISRDDQQPVTPTAKPEVVNSIVIKQQPENKASDGAQQKITESLGGKQEKPKQSELSQPVNNVGSSIPKNVEIQVQSEPVNAAGIDKESNNKPSDVTQVKMVEQLWVKQEKIKQAEVSSIAIKQQPKNKAFDGAQQKITESLEVKQEKPKQSELSQPVNNVGPSVPKNLEIKSQSEPVNAAGIDKESDNKPSDVTQVKMAERLWANQEKLKQAELRKTVNSVEPSTPNNLEIIQIPQKPVEIAAVPEEPVIETAASQQVEPEGSLAQSANSFTLQLIVLSKQSSVNGMLKKYPALEPDFRIIKTVVNGQEKFILNYGSYPNTASANNAKQSLPFEFRNALVRKISSIKHR